jgi:SAM-dependent methyltransferase
MAGEFSAVISDRRALKYLLKSVAKSAIDKYQVVKVSSLRAAGVVDFPVPPNSRMRGTSSHTIRHYYESGLTTTLPVITAAYIEGVDLRKPGSVLDFGCGVGRQLLHMAKFFPALKLSACDVNNRSMEFIKRAYPKVDSYTSEFFPPLKYADRQFDLIYSVSIFSHLNVKDNQLWLRELARITRPQGLCCLTILGTHAMEIRSDQSNDGPAPPGARKTLEERGFFYEGYYKGYAKPDYMKAAEKLWNIGSNLIGIDEDYGVNYFTEPYIRQHWNNDDFEVRQYVPGIIDQLQDLVVLKRR